MSASLSLGPLWLVGCGNMGGAMLRRWLMAGIDPALITVIDPAEPDAPPGVNVLPDASSAPYPETIVLAIKPQQLKASAEALLAPISGTPPLLISILAGIEEETLQSAFHADAVVRAMPNLPVSLGKGVVVLHSRSTDPEYRDIAEALMAPLGHVEWIADETLFDAVTALSGCGPGFVFRFIDALAAAGAALGLPDDQAQRLALATVEGSAMMAAAASEPPAVLADRVASPGGMTRVGLNVLDEDEALNRLLARTLEAANRRGAEMAAAARGG